MSLIRVADHYVNPAHIAQIHKHTDKEAYSAYMVAGPAIHLTPEEVVELLDNLSNSPFADSAAHTADMKILRLDNTVDEFWKQIEMEG